MAGPFRFAPPMQRRGTLTRPRLLRYLLGRFTHRCTVVVGGAGHGKTTLLAQAVAENRLAPRGDDVWFGLDRGDAVTDASTLARDLLSALGAPTEPATPAAIATAIWQRAPTDVCLLLDDAHVLQHRSEATALVVELLDTMPTNGHLLCASRTVPPLPLARLASQGAVLRLDEAQLRFDDDELKAFADGHAVDPEQLSRTAGWPAMAELVAVAGVDLAGDYLWQEVLEPIGTEQRRLFAVLCDLGGGDDGLLSVALGRSVHFDGDVPLVARDASGWHEPHALWHTVDAVQLEPADRRAIRSRVAPELAARGRYDAAFRLLADVSMWEGVPAVLKTMFHDAKGINDSQLTGWLAECPEAVLGTPPGRLATAVLTAAEAAPDGADAPWRDVASAFRAAGDIEGELTAIMHFGYVAWLRRDAAAMAIMGPRVEELATSGSRTATALSLIGRALTSGLQGDNDRMLAALDAIPAGALTTAFDGLIGWWRAQALYGLGDPDAALTAIEAVLERVDETWRPMIEYFRWGLWWQLGRIDEVLAATPALISTAEIGRPASVAGTAARAARHYSFVGAIDLAREYLDRGPAVAADEDRGAYLQQHVARASIAVAEADETRATALLQSALERSPLVESTLSFWLPALPLTYVLVPEARPTWDALPLVRDHVWARELAVAVVGGRGAVDWDPIHSVDVTDTARVRAMLPFPFAAELALRLHECGRSADAASLLESLGEAGRTRVRAVASTASKALLSAVPLPPSERVRIGTFGPLRVNGTRVARTRVRELLALLLLRRTMSRTEVTAELWPDLSERAAATNLRVTLAYLLRVLEPDRREGDAVYFIRQTGAALRLVSDMLEIDFDDFDAHLDAATVAENDGAPSVALDHYTAATELYAGDLLADLPDAAWADVERERCRARFVRAAVRAGELLAAADDPERAEHLARRALAVDEWSESAYAILVTAALARDERSAAMRILEQCATMLAELGVEPSEPTRRLIRRVQSGEC